MPDNAILLGVRLTNGSFSREMPAATLIGPDDLAILFADDAFHESLSGTNQPRSQPG